MSKRILVVEDQEDSRRIIHSGAQGVVGIINSGKDDSRVGEDEK